MICENDNQHYLYGVFKLSFYFLNITRTFNFLLCLIFRFRCYFQFETKQSIKKESRRKKKTFFLAIDSKRTKADERAGKKKLAEYRRE